MPSVPPVVVRLAEVQAVHRRFESGASHGKSVLAVTELSSD
ncbi:hypothetical protein [Kitasatospora sp. NBC_01266]|nr:hypothetical protein [Kitasatospora sp. NBC_01266]